MSNGTARNAVFLCQSSSPADTNPILTPDQQNLFCGQQLFAKWSTGFLGKYPVLCSMFFVREVFEIAQAWVMWIAICMMYFRPLLGRSKKGECNQTVYADGPLTTVSRQLNGKILIAGQLFQHKPDRGPLALLDSADSAQVGHFIQGFISNNVSPFFGFKFLGGIFRSSHAVHPPVMNGLVRAFGVLLHPLGSLFVQETF